MPTFVVGATIETVRINELPLFSVYGPLTTSDHFAMWLAAFNKTVKIDAASMYAFFHDAGGGTTTPVNITGKVLHVVTVGEDGGDTVSLPQFAGQNFFLERDGQPLTVSEYQILNAGGFKITITDPVTGDHDKLSKDQRFVLTFYELVGGSSGGSGGSGSSLINGVLSVPNSIAFDPVNHIGKLLQFRGDTTKIVFTLPLIGSIPANTIIPIEASITNTVEHTIQTQDGQLIYLNNTSKTTIHIRPGEVLWLYRGEDGYYILNDFAKTYRELARPYAAYAPGLNELVCKGQILNRADYPRLWEYVQSLGLSLITDTLWNTSAIYWNGTAFVTTQPVSGHYITVQNPYRGCFSSGDGVGTFRLPNLMSMHLRGVNSEIGTDPTRYYNNPGGFQKNAVGPHVHGGVPLEIEDIDRGGSHSDFSVDNLNGESAENFNMGENLVDNVGMLWVIKC